MVYMPGIVYVYDVFLSVLFSQFPKSQLYVLFCGPPDIIDVKVIFSQRSDLRGVASIPTERLVLVVLVVGEDQII